MGKKSREKRERWGVPANPGPPHTLAPVGIRLPADVQGKEVCDSLLDEMVDGQEYASILNKFPRKFNARDEIRRAMADVEAIRKRPLIIYAANQVKALPGGLTAITGSDNLPFAELLTPA